MYNNKRCSEVIYTSTQGMTAWRISQPNFRFMTVQQQQSFEIHSQAIDKTGIFIYNYPKCQFSWQDLSMSQMSQVPQVSECRHLEMGKECGDFPDDQVTIFWRKIMALMDNVMAIRLGSRHDVFRVSNMNAHIMHTCIYIHSHTHIYTHFLESDMGKNI